MNPRLEALHAYPFERVARLKAGITPPPALAHIALSSGEPQHAPRQCLLKTLRCRVDEPGSYLAPAHGRGNRGARRVRSARVPALRPCVQAAEPIRDFLRVRPAAVPNLRA